MECSICFKTFSQPQNLNRHMRNTHNIFEEKKEIKSWKPFNFNRDICEYMYLCPVCQVPYLTEKERDIHYNRHQIPKLFNCSNCSKPFSDSIKRDLHQKFCARRPYTQSEEIQVGGSENISSEKDTAEDEQEDELDDINFTAHAKALWCY